MPINKKHRLLFVHIPKNAGSSAAKLIKSYPDNRHTFNKETLYGIDPSNGLVLQSMPYKFYKLYLDNYKNFTKFTIIRNPYDRFLSDYSWDNITHTTHTHQQPTHPPSPPPHPTHNSNPHTHLHPLPTLHTHTFCGSCGSGSGMTVSSGITRRE